MRTVKDTAKLYRSYGLSVIPLIGENGKEMDTKKPALYSWEPLQEKPLTDEEIDLIFALKSIRTEIEKTIKPKDREPYTVKGIKAFTEPHGLGIITGSVSGSLEVIDIDTKHDTTGTLWEDFMGLLRDNLPDVYPTLVITQTRSGGSHIYYRCTRIEGNLKLSIKTNREVLIETRGEGGYVVAPPTPGYKFLQGGAGTIPTITPEEREVILTIARSFTEIGIEEEKPRPRATSSEHYGPGLSPFEDYNLRGDVITLLESRGWRVVGERGDRISLLRPGQTDSKTSGNFHTGLRTLYVFSTSTEFRENRGYSPSQVFSLLECSGDNKTAYWRLLELGYGEHIKKPKTAPTQLKTEVIKVEEVNKVTRVNTVISSPGDTLRVENIQAVTGEAIRITSPGPEATDEELKAVEIAETTRKKIYIKEGDEPELKSYQYKLQAILIRYGNIMRERGELTALEIDNLLDEVVEMATKITEPIDKDRYIKEFISYPGIKNNLGITEESLAITIERLTTTRAKEKQTRELKILQDEVKELLDKGDLEGAIKLQEAKVKEIKTITTSGLLPPPMGFNALLDEIAQLPPAQETGYSSLDKFVGFTPGAISLIAGRPSHGKTTLMFNLLLEMSKKYPGKNYYFFTYEEPVKNLAVKILNRLTATDLSPYFWEAENLARNTNYEFLKSYIRAGRTDLREVEEGKRQFKELIDSQRIKLIDKNYSVEELHKLILYLIKREKIGGVFIDYIQRMRTERRTQDKRTEIAHISDMVLQIAKDTDLPIILGAQFRRVEGKGKPTLDNLKEAGNLEEDANTVLRVWNQSREDEENNTGENLKEVELEITALKNREGEANVNTSLLFDRPTGVIRDKGY